MKVEPPIDLKHIGGRGEHKIKIFNLKHATIINVFNALSSTFFVSVDEPPAWVDTPSRGEHKIKMFNLKHATKIHVFYVLFSTLII